MESVKLEHNEVLYQSGDGIAILTLNRPEMYNAITHNLKDDLIQGLKLAHRDHDIKAVILTGAGKGFSAGADLSAFMGDINSKDVQDDLHRTYNVITTMITQMSKPVICALNGTIAGASLGFALACDIKIMADSAKLRYPFLDIALVPDAGSSWFLVQAVGYAKAYEIITEGKKYSAEECQQLGLINHIAPKDEIMDHALAYAKKIVNGPTKAYQQTKKLLRFAEVNGLADTMAKEAELQETVILGHDNMEGSRAFLEKRAPKFIGK